MSDGITSQKRKMYQISKLQKLVCQYYDLYPMGNMTLVELESGILKESKMTPSEARDYLEGYGLLFYCEYS